MNAHDQSTHDALPSSSNNDAQCGATIWRSKWVFGGFAAIVVLMLAVEHRMHLVAWLPWIILAACPLMHLFMHGGHGSHGNDSKPGNDK